MTFLDDWTVIHQVNLYLWGDHCILLEVLMLLVWVWIHLLGVVHLLVVLEVVEVLYHLTAHYYHHLLHLHYLHYLYHPYLLHLHYHLNFLLLISMPCMLFQSLHQMG